MGIKTGHQWFRANAFAPMIQPKGRFAGDGGKSVALEVWIGMGETRRVVPHLTRMSDVCPKMTFCPMMQFAIGEGVRTIEHGFGLWPVSRPVGSTLLMTAVDATHG